MSGSPREPLLPRPQQLARAVALKPAKHSQAESTKEFRDFSIWTAAEAIASVRALLKAKVL